MSTHKTAILETAVQLFLCRRLGVEVEAVEPLAGGESSAAFAFEHDGRSLVIRVNKHGDHGFLKDRFAHEVVGSELVPVPEIVEIGELDDGAAYAIGERAPGRCLDAFSRRELDSTLPALVRVMDAIHQLPPPGEGYGVWGPSAQASHRSWREFVLADVQTDSEVDRCEGVDRELHVSLRGEVAQLADKVPEERRLVHGDLGYGNVAAEAGSITAVFDWESSMYGDPLYDTAWLAFWATSPDYTAIIRSHYKSSHGQVPPRFDARVHTYRLLIGLQAMRFFVWSGQPDKYQFARDRVTSIRG